MRMTFFFFFLQILGFVGMLFFSRESFFLDAKSFFLDVFAHFFVAVFAHFLAVLT